MAPENERQVMTTYTCPMHPEIRESAPGDCPKCGMALEALEPLTRTEVQEWTCPMHPEVVQDHPGDCPKCGMTLEPRRAVAADEENVELRSMTIRFWVSAAISLPL